MWFLVGSSECGAGEVGQLSGHLDADYISGGAFDLDWEAF